VTGGNAGIGYYTVFHLAKHNAKVYLGSRNATKGNQAIEEIKAKIPNANVQLLLMDLMSMQSVIAAANELLTKEDKLHGLINNAGIMATPAGTTQEGYEIQFGTNHMGHALLTKLLLPKLEATAKLPDSDVRIVTLSSAGHQWVPNGGLVLEECHSDMNSTTTFARYGQSKLANILYSNELAKRYHTIRSISVHPGSVNTGLKRGLSSSYPWITIPVNFLSMVFTVTVEQGALNQLWAATSKDAKSGKYYVPVAKESAGSAYAQDAELQSKLWKWTEDELDKFLKKNPL